MHNYILEYHKWIETHFKLLYSLYCLCYLCHLIEKIKLNTGCPECFWGTLGDQKKQIKTRSLIFWEYLRRIINFGDLSQKSYNRFFSTVTSFKFAILGTLSKKDESFHPKSPIFFLFLHQIFQICFLCKYVVYMDEEVTNTKYELIWTNSLSDIQDYVSHVLVIT